MRLIQILLPLTDNDGAAFPEAVLRSIQQEQVDRFGGLTAYERSPARGIWQRDGAQQKDEVVIVEVMSNNLDEDWWREFRKRVERELRQEKLIVRAIPCEEL
ncbi:MAG: hypothetical protein JOZ72_13895 [Alphaproteobacteria bacterium]|nr:hypothetical protein [Alphaproteobacteria bacterium]